MKTKSKVTSIRVEPELYEKFKKVVELQNKEVSSVIGELMYQHIGKHEERMQLIIGKYGIDFSKVSRYSFQSISNFGADFSEKYIENCIKLVKSKSNLKKPIAINIETEDIFHVDILLLELKETENESSK